MSKKIEFHAINLKILISSLGTSLAFLSIRIRNHFSAIIKIASKSKGKIGVS
jgi:hypothetical protein